MKYLIFLIPILLLIDNERAYGTGRRAYKRKKEKLDKFYYYRIKNRRWYNKDYSGRKKKSKRYF